MAPGSIAMRVHKRAISDQQRRRDLALQRQAEGRRNLQIHARRLAAGLSTSAKENDTDGDDEIGEAGDEDLAEVIEREGEDGLKEKTESTPTEEDPKDVGLQQGTRLKGAKARAWFSKQLMLPEWMVDIPLRLQNDWYLNSVYFGKISCSVHSLLHYLMQNYGLLGLLDMNSVVWLGSSSR